MKKIKYAGIALLLIGGWLAAPLGLLRGILVIITLCAGSGLVHWALED